MNFTIKVHKIFMHFFWRFYTKYERKGEIKMNNVLDNFMLKIDHITFENIDDLYSRRDKIRNNYAILDFNEKQIYKWYFFYQLCLLKNPLKKIAWEYVNGADRDVEFYNCYKDFLVKRNKIILAESIKID